MMAGSVLVGDREAAFAEAIAAQEYLRERLEPRPGDPFYLCLSDLLIAIRSLMPSHPSRVLDYGCGGSPYRPLFGECTYHRADLAGSNLDFEYAADGRLPPEATDYDFVLSTQVLEHVEDPKAYLQECYRVLRPGGHLLLTTHGIFEDHAVPHDYWRWTAGGLQRMIEEVAGLKVRTVKKLTTGPRGVLALSEREFHRLRFDSAGAYGALLSLGIRAVQRLGARRLHEVSDKSFPHHRVADASESDHNIYIGLAVLAIREGKRG